MRLDRTASKRRSQVLLPGPMRTLLTCNRPTCGLCSEPDCSAPCAQPYAATVPTGLSRATHGSELTAAPLDRPSLPCPGVWLEQSLLGQVSLGPAREQVPRGFLHKGHYSLCPRSATAWDGCPLCGRRPPHLAAPCRAETSQRSSERGPQGRTSQRVT